LVQALVQRPQKNVRELVQALVASLLSTRGEKLGHVRALRWMAVMVDERLMHGVVDSARHFPSR